MNKFFLWLKASMEGTDGRASARSLTNGWYVFINSCITLFIIYFTNKIIEQPRATNQAVDALWALIWLCVIYNVTILVIFGIVSIQQVTSGIRAVRGEPEPPGPQPGDDVNVVMKAKVAQQATIVEKEIKNE